MPITALYKQAKGIVCSKSLQQAVHVVITVSTVMFVTAEEAQETVKAVKGEYL